MRRRPAKQAAAEATQRKGNTVAVVLCIAAVALAFGVVLLLRHSRPASDPAGPYVPRPKGQLTFNKDIAPILFHQCAGCHRPGEVGPFSLLTYKDVQAHAADIADVTGRGYMPPWLPEHGNPAMSGERHLTPEEIGVIRQWVAEGATEGSPGDQPALPKWTEGWQLGTPDLVVEMPEAYPLQADGRDVYRNFVIPLSLKTRRFVRAVEFRPNSKVIHHVFIRFDRTRQSRRMDAQDPGIGFGGMTLPPSAESPGGYFLSWQPGRGPTQSPKGLAWPLEPGNDILLQAHMQPSGKPEAVRPSIGFYFTDQAPTNTPYKISLSSVKIDIPPESRSYEIQDSYVLPVDVEVLSVLPHAHYLAKEIQGFAILPNGERRSLLNIHDWDFNWQSDYRYQEPIHLPKGTRIGMRFTYDNSSGNVRNPNKPPIRVNFGSRSTDEMCELWLQLLPGNPEDLRTLVADNGRRMVQEILDYNALMLRRNPADAHAHVQYAKALASMGRSKEAMEHLRQAVQINPDEEEGHYHVGVLLMDSDPSGAAMQFSETLRVDPENFKARNNLGLMLMNLGRFAEAEVQFREALKLNPGDPIIRDNLELLRQKAGQP